jgi:hypothetical protein
MTKRGALRDALASFVKFHGARASALPRETLYCLQQLTLRADPIETVHEEVKKERFVRGFVAGTVLHLTVTDPNIAKNLLLPQ